MSKQIEIYYSQQASDFVAGRAYSNPRFFSTPRANASKVYIYGNWPEIEAAYTTLGVPVERMDSAPTVSPTAVKMPVMSYGEPGRVTIPEGWRDLPWTKGEVTLRGLASRVSTAKVINSADAIAAIEAEIARRAVDEPIVEADGLTMREIHCDVAAAGHDVDPTLSLAEKLALRDDR